jgi:hypothetical protein
MKAPVVVVSQNTYSPCHSLWMAPMKFMIFINAMIICSNILSFATEGENLDCFMERSVVLGILGTMEN